MVERTVGSDSSGMDTAANHFRRAQEGARLLAQGKSLAEMQTPITGSSKDELLARRTAYLEGLATMTNDKLLEYRERIMRGLDRLYNSETRGTSEYEWRRIQVDQLLQERGIQIPQQ